MHHSPIRRLVFPAALATALLTAATGCQSGPVSPLPVQQPGPSSQPSAATPVPSSPAATLTASPSAAKPAPPPPPARPAPSSPAVTPARTSPGRTPPSAGTGRPSACMGAEQYEIDRSEPDLLMTNSLCFATGGVLRIRNIGPNEGLTATPENLVSSSYEGGVIDLRFVRAGTVSVRVPLRSGGWHPITVVVR